MMNNVLFAAVLYSENETQDTYTKWFPGKRNRLIFNLIFNFNCTTPRQTHIQIAVLGKYL